MSKDLDLFGPNKYGRDMAMEKACLFTAWSLFSWQTNFDYHFFRRPYFSQPPQVPLPNPQLDPTWYGEISMQYPHVKALVPLHTGPKMYAEAALREIMNDIGLRVFGNPSPQPLTFDEFAALKEKLDRWRAILPEPLQPKLVVFPFHLMLHVVYWQVVKDFIKLIVNADHLCHSQCVALCLGKPPETALYEARVKLETVVCLYYARHSFDSYDPWLAYALTIIGNTMATELKTASSSNQQIFTGYRSMLVLSAQGLAKQSSSYHNGTLLAVQLQGAMDATNLQLVRTYTTHASISEPDRKMIAEHSISNWPLPAMVAINEDPEEARLSVMVEAL
ncbi:hypothetical protein E8E12_008584 [Didymella heteroderae]|uniref:Transcription factor domain-containing protein n=1 Tax=Didymella heteroderae TaxID=1769908 RepID=A0A9P5C075_9PLEO|nr:hypothetical protein E8E12_008584 [Didymella heteroderae]